MRYMVPDKAVAEQYYYPYISKHFPQIPDLFSCGYTWVKHATNKLLSTYHSDVLDIGYVERGINHWWIGKEKFIIPAGHAYLIWPNENYGWINKISEPHKSYNIGLLLPKGNQKNKEWLNLSPQEGGMVLQALHVLRRKRHFPVPDRIVGPYLSLLQKIKEPRGKLKVVEARAALLEIIMTVIRAGNEKKDSTRSLMISEAMKIMESSLEAPLAIPDIAKRLGWSTVHFKRRFKAEAGIPPAEFYQRRRIDEACRQLEQTGLNITRISYGLGFSSTGYFCHAFKKITGMTPQSYRLKTKHSPS